jgi:hypothetical protein
MEGYHTRDLPYLSQRQERPLRPNILWRMSSLWYERKGRHKKRGLNKEEITQNITRQKPGCRGLDQDVNLTTRGWDGKNAEEKICKKLSGTDHHCGPDRTFYQGLCCAGL